MKKNSKDIIQIYEPIYDRVFVGSSRVVTSDHSDTGLGGDGTPNSGDMGTVDQKQRGSKIIPIGEEFCLTQKFYLNRDQSIILRSNNTHSKLFRKTSCDA